MFYSHEILTSRKYGVATIWLVATLGQASTLRKVGKKAIQDVNVPKACGMIISPQAPMALRLQSHLLYGISRVYAEQCTYVLSDLQNIQSTIRTYLATIRSGGIDMAAQKNRQEDLLLPENPTFQPDILLPMVNLEELLDLDPKALRLPFVPEPAFDSSGLGPNASSAPLPLELPSDSLAFPDAGLLEDSRWNGRSSTLDKGRDFILDDIIIVDDNGAILDVGPTTQTGITTPQDQSRVGASGAMDGKGGELASANGSTSGLTSSEKGDTSSAWVESVEEQEQAAHKLRATRTKKALPVDRTLELRNRDINGSSARYIEIMLAAEKERIARSIPHQAKKNAYHWILGVGLNGVGASTYGLSNPLEMFTGTTLYEMIGQTVPATMERKRSHDADEAEDEAARNVRRRLEDDRNTVGHGDDPMEADDSNIEAAREAGKELTDVSSAMPWNTASFRGSSVGRASSVLGAAPGSATKAPGSVRRSLAPLRLLSTSPLVPGSVERHSVTLDDDGFQLIHDDDIEDSAGNGRGLQHTWQTADGGLPHDSEQLKFLAFVQAGVERKQSEEGHATVCDIDFEELLDPAANTRAVAAQALIHVLSLATWGSLIVEQADHFGRIRMQAA